MINEEAVLLAESVKGLSEAQLACAESLEAIGQSLGSIQTILQAQHGRIKLLENEVAALKNKLAGRDDNL